MSHGSSVSELRTVFSVHVPDDPFQIVSVHNIRDSGVVSVKVLDAQLPKHWTLCQQMEDSVILCWHCANKWRTVSTLLYRESEGLYRAIYFAEMMIETSMASQI